MKSFFYLIPILLLVIPLINGESDSKRSNDGFNDGSNAARTDTTFNPDIETRRDNTVFSIGWETIEYKEALLA